MKKRGLEKEKLMGKIQLIIGVGLLIGTLIGLIAGYLSYRESVNDNLAATVDSIELLKGARRIQFSNETFYLGYLDIVNHYNEENSSLFNHFTNSAFSLGLLMTISALFITQGIVNLSKRKE